MRNERWSSRFSEGLNPLALRFTASIDFDRKLYLYDIIGSIAHCQMLAKCGLLKSSESHKITKGLKEVAREVEGNRFSYSLEKEDIHTNIEAALIRKIGPVGGKLHTARSRNDQVTLDLRLYCRDQLQYLILSLMELEKAALGLAEKNIDVIIPGYTHLQRAQPVLFSHHLLAYVAMWERDRERLVDALTRVNVLPLGSGALAGTTFPIDREYVAKKLGFARVSHNSLDAVSDRDYAIEIAAATSIIMMHLSRLCEELILWSSEEFGFIGLPQSFCTGSSMMPQKINPDVAELVRGKTGRVYGHLISLLTLMKSLPLAYNKDMQEDKEPLFDTFDTVSLCLEVMAQMLPKITVNKKKIEASLPGGYLLATDLADWLVTQGLPFKQAHGLTGSVVQYCAKNNKEIYELTQKEWKTLLPKIKSVPTGELTFKKAIQKRSAIGGTSLKNVKKEIKACLKKLETFP